MQSPKVSILIPVHNGEGYVGKAIRSVLAQTWSDFEIVVLDDGSTDASARVARAFGDSRVRVYRRDEHAGVAATRNHLLIAATAPFVGWLDADDVATPERLERQMEHLESHTDLAMVCSAFFEIDANGQTLRKRSLPRDHDALATRLLHGKSVPTSTVLMRRQAIDAAGGFDETLGLGAEQDLFLKVCAKWKVASLREPLVKCRLHSRAVSYVERHERRMALDEACRRAVLRQYERPLEWETEAPTSATEGTPSEDMPVADRAALIAEAERTLEGQAVNDVPLAEGTIEDPVAAPVGEPVAEDADVGTADAEDDVSAVAASAVAPTAPAPTAGAVRGLRGDLTQPELFAVEPGAVEPGAVEPGAVEPGAVATGAPEVAAGSGEESPASLDSGASEAVEDGAVAARNAIQSEAGATAESVDDDCEAVPAQAVVADGTALASQAETESADGEADDGVEPETVAITPVKERVPAVAVVLLANGSQALEAVRSVLDQTMSDLTLAVVSSGTDDALERGLEMLADRRVILLEAGAVSRARALNVGVLATRSRYVAYLAENALYRPKHLETLLEVADAERLGFIYSDIGLATKGLEGAAVSGRDFDADRLLKENYIATEAVLHRRDLLHEVGLFNEGLTEGMEWELWVYMTRRAPARRLAGATVDRMVAAGRDSKLAPSPGKVRRYLSDKFARRSRRDGVESMPMYDEAQIDGDMVARAQERFRKGDWAGAASELVDAASRSFSALSQLFSPPYPEREVPDGDLLAVEVPRLETRPRARVEAGAERPVTAPALRGQPVTMPRATSVPQPMVAERGVAAMSVPGSLAMGVEPSHEAVALAADATVAPTTGGDHTRGRASAWIYTQSGLVGTGRSRGVRPKMGAPAPAMTTGTRLLGNRRKAMSTLAQSPPCPMCGSTKQSLVYRAGWYRVLDCGKCDTAFSYPRMEPGLAVRFFSDRRSVIVPPTLRTAEDLAGTPYDRSRELAWVREYVPAGRLLDVGCGWGYATAQARALGYDAVGCEISRPLARIARERFGLEVYERDVQSLQPEAGSIDAVLATHVLQHLSDPRGFLGSVHGALRDGGVLVLSVPNFNAYLREALGRRWRWLDPESQPHHFRPNGLRLELEAAGFAVQMWTSEGLYGDKAALELVDAKELKELAAAGRGSELACIATKGSVH